MAPAYIASVTIDPAALGRFSGFADLYDANRPSPPATLGPLLTAYANVPQPAVVDLGAGTGLSSRWASAWAASVVGIEPNDEMRAVAQARPTPGVEYRTGRWDRSGLEDASADVVLVVQAMHWMEPEPTLAEVGRILRPGGVLAVIDADWPPVAGVAKAEQAWADLHRRIRVLEARLTRGETAAQLRRPVEPDDPALAEDDLVDQHRNRIMPGGLRSWSKSAHLERMAASDLFSCSRELVLMEEHGGGAEQFKGLMYSQGSYQGLIKAGITDGELGTPEFEQEVDDGFAQARAVLGLSFCWRTRLGVRRS